MSSATCNADATPATAYPACAAIGSSGANARSDASTPIDYHLQSAMRAARAGQWRICESNAAAAVWRLADQALHAGDTRSSLQDPSVELILERTTGQGAHRAILRALPPHTGNHLAAVMCLDRAQRSLAANQPLAAAAWSGAAAQIACYAHGGDTTIPVQGLDVVTGRGARVGNLPQDEDFRTGAAVDAVVNLMRQKPEERIGAGGMTAVFAWAAAHHRAIANHEGEILSWIDRQGQREGVWNLRAPAFPGPGWGRPRPQMLLSLHVLAAMGNG